MKRILFKSFAIATMALISGNAWAEWDKSSAVYVKELDKSCSTLQEAVQAAMDDTGTTTEFTVEIHNNVTIGSKRVELSKAKTINIVPMADNLTITKGTMNRNVMWFLNKSNNANLNIGNSDYKLIIQGEGTENENQQIQNYVIRQETGGAISVKNVEFKNFWFNSWTNTEGTQTTYGFLFDNKSTGTGKLLLENISVSNCKTELNAFIRTILTSSDIIQLKGYLNFENCTGTCFDIKGRIKLGDTNNTYDGFSATTPISVTWNGATTPSGSATSIPVIVKVPSKNAKDFYLTNDDYGLVLSGSDLKLAQAHTITTSSDAKGAATLVLPFNATIPEGVTAYTLNNTGDGNVIETTKVENTLDADKPVLINTKEEGGSYKFIATTAFTGSKVTGSGTPNNGLLTGVYQETDVPSGCYILAKGKDSGLVGFYKVNTDNTKKVQANHAYLTIDTSDASKPSFFRVIGGGDGGTTLIKGVETNEEKAQEGVYNLNGVRMDKPERKGIYIVNGKKSIVK